MARFMEGLHPRIRDIVELHDHVSMNLNSKGKIETHTIILDPLSLILMLMENLLLKVVLIKVLKRVLKRISISITKRLSNRALKILRMATTTRAFPLLRPHITNEKRRFMKEKKKLKINATSSALSAWAEGTLPLNALARQP